MCSVIVDRRLLIKPFDYIERVISAFYLIERKVNGYIADVESSLHNKNHEELIFCLRNFNHLFGE